MSEAPLIESALEPRLSWQEIKDRYPDQWVVLVEMVWDDEETLSALRSAVVAAHSPNRREPLEQAAPLRPRYPCMGHFYTGRIRSSFRPPNGASPIRTEAIHRCSRNRLSRRSAR